MNKEQMKDYSDLFRHLYEQGHIRAEGDVYFGDILTIDVDDTSSDYGFIGKPNVNMARKHTVAEKILEQWSKSGNPFERKAAASCPRMFVFIDDQAMWDSMTTEQKDMVRNNHNWAFRMYDHEQALAPLVDENYTRSEDTFFISLQNYNFPKTEGREKWLESHFDMEKWLTFWLTSKRDNLMYGGTGLL